MGKILGWISVSFLVLASTACSANMPTVREVEEAMREEYKQVFPSTVDVEKLVALKKLESCKKDEKTEGVLICVVQAEKEMQADADGKKGALLEVALRKESGKWETVKDILN